MKSCLSCQKDDHENCPGTKCFCCGVDEEWRQRLFDSIPMDERELRVAKIAGAQWTE